jgi:enterochelin esterase family protein
MRFSLAFLAVIAAFAQPPAQQRLVSPEVHTDRTVTFRFRAPNAQKVEVAREGLTQRLALTKDDQGVWSGTSEAWEPDLYGYSFIVDGVPQMDPLDSKIKPNLLNPQSVVHIPGSSDLPWEIRNVPRGSVHHHFYHSTIIGDDRDFYVYTPPNYDGQAKTPYPVLFLLHGFSDDASGWTAVGRAHVIFDNLIASGKAKPMLVVMPLGYGAPEIVAPNANAFRDPELMRRNYERFRDATLNEVMPAVEKTYNVSKDRTQRAIAGLSMGGAESLFTGLGRLDRFAWVGAFSAGGGAPEYDKTYPNLKSEAGEKLKLLWMACGTEDRLIEPNRKFVDWLKSNDIRHTWVETPGAHTWMVWRRYLAEFAPLLFRTAS